MANPSSNQHEYIDLTPTERAVILRYREQVALANVSLQTALNTILQLRDCAVENETWDVSPDEQKLIRRPPPVVKEMVLKRGVQNVSGE